MNYLFRALLTLGALSIAAANIQAQEVQWLRSAEQAAELAAQSGKPILVYVRSASCHYCDLMQKNIWQNPATAAIITRDFIPLKLTREENGEAVDSLKIKGFPSVFIFSADREYLDRFDGYVEPDQFLSKVQRLHLAATQGSRVPR